MLVDSLLQVSVQQCGTHYSRCSSKLHSTPYLELFIRSTKLEVLPLKSAAGYSERGKATTKMLYTSEIRSTLAEVAYFSVSGWSPKMATSPEYVN